MSEAIHFDSHRFVKRLTEAGMSERTAEVLADEQMNLIQGELATKHDIALVQRNGDEIRQQIKQMDVDLRKEIAQGRSDLRKEIAQGQSGLRMEIEQMRTALQLEIEQSKFALLRWMAGMFVAQGGVIVALLRLTGTA